MPKTNYCKDSLQNDIESMHSEKSSIESDSIDNTKHNINKCRCVSFRKALKKRPNLKSNRSKAISNKQSKVPEEDDEKSKNPWCDLLVELQKRKLDQVAFTATRQNCRLCERDEPYRRFKRKMEQNYSDSELNDHEDLTCLNSWTSYSKKKTESTVTAPPPLFSQVIPTAAQKDADVSNIIYVGSCICKKENYTCNSEDLQNSIVIEVPDQDIRPSNPEATYVGQTSNPTDIYRETGEGDSPMVNQNTRNTTSSSTGKETSSSNLYKLKKFQNTEIPRPNVIIEELQLKQKANKFQGLFVMEGNNSSETLIPDTNFPPLFDNDPSLTITTPVLGTLPACMMDSKYKPDCCYGCGILGCACNFCKLLKPPEKCTTKSGAPKPKKVKIDRLENFLNRCEQCGMNCNCWTHKVDHAKQYLQELKQILTEKITYDTACGTRDSQEDIASTKSENICIICGHRDCNCKYSQEGRPSLYFQTIEFGTSLHQTTTFGKVFQEKIKMDEARGSGLDGAPSCTRVDMEKLRTISLKHQSKKSIIKNCKNKFMVTPAQKAKSIIKNKIKLVIQSDLYGVPHVIQYPDKRPIPQQAKEEDCHSLQSESSDDDTEVVHNLKPWYCTEKSKEENLEITYGRIL